MIIVKQFKFEAAHHLPGHPTCGSLHGHSYKVEIAVVGPVDASSGMVMDFAELTRLVGPLIEQLDHALLNGKAVVEQPPTAENVAASIWDHLDAQLDRGYGGSTVRPTPIEIAWIKVWETDSSYAYLDGTGALDEFQLRELHKLRWERRDKMRVVHTLWSSPPEYNIPRPGEENEPSTDDPTSDDPAGGSGDTGQPGSGTSGIPSGDEQGL